MSHLFSSTPSLAANYGTDTAITHEPYAYTKEPSVDKDENFITLHEAHMAGSILFVFSLASIVINSYFSVLIFKNWDIFRKSCYFNTNLLCLLLTLADLAFVVLLGFPTGLHLTWIDHFKSNVVMHFYSTKICHIIFKFIFYLRIIIIAVISLDRCLHLLRQVQYSKLATKRRMKYVVGIIFLIPVLTCLLPILILAGLNKWAVICGQFQDPTADEAEKVRFFRKDFILPLTCDISLRITPPGTATPLVFATVFSGMTIAAWLVIVVSNLSIILMIVKHTLKPINMENPERRKRMTKNLIRTSLMVLFITLLFLVSSFPYVWIDLSEYIREHTKGLDSRINLDYKTKFYLTMLTFIPVIIHPWLYLMRMRTVQDLTPQVSQTMSESFRKAIGSLQQYMPLRTSISSRNSSGKSRSALEVPNHTGVFMMSPIPSPRLLQDNKPANGT